MKPVYYRTNSGRRCALLVSEGRVYNHLIVMDSAGLTMTKVASTERLQEIENCSKPLDRFKNAAKQFGCTKTVARHLGLKDAIPAPTTNKEVREEVTTPERKQRARKEGIKATGKKRSAKKRPAPKAKANTKAASKAAAQSARGESKAVFIKYWNELASGKLDQEKAIAQMAKGWDISNDRAQKRFRRLARELGVATDNPQPIKEAA